MPYTYEEEREKIFTDDGQRLFLAIRDRTRGLLEAGGAARLQEIIAGACGDSWQMLACVDRMVELGEIREVPQDGISSQHRIFVSR